jgi:hypothetical protein
MMSHSKLAWVGYAYLVNIEQEKAVFKLSLCLIHQQKKVNYVLYVIL